MGDKDRHLPPNPAGAGWVTLSFSPNGQTLASGGEDRAVVERAGRNVLQTAARSQQSFGKLLLIRLVKPSRVAVQTVQLDYGMSGTCLKTFQGRTNGVRSVSFSPNGSMLPAVAVTMPPRLWDWQQET